MTRASNLAKTGEVVDTGGYGFRNRIINGNFDFWQRGTSFSTAGYTADRWAITYDGTGATRTVSQQAFTLGQTSVPYEPTYFLRFNQSVAGSGGSYNQFYQPIESVRTFAGQTVTVSFYAQSSTTSTFPIINLRQFFGSGGSPSAFVETQLATNVSIGSSWTKYTYTATLPSISGKTMGTAGDYLALFVWMPINTTFTVDIAQVQVEAGSIATAFERRPYGLELSLCQRYYQTTYDIGVTPGTATRNGLITALAYSGAATYGSGFNLQSPMRAAPSLSYWDGAGNASKVSYYAGSAWSDNNAFLSSILVLSTKSIFVVTNVAASAALMIHYTASAEL